MAKYYELLHPLPGCKKGQIFCVAEKSPWAKPLGKLNNKIYFDSKLVETSRWWFKEVQSKQGRKLAVAVEVFFKSITFK